jgi:tape measure domain-containing protein
MADLATLQVKVDAAQAIQDTQRLGNALKQTAQQGPLMSAAMNKTGAEVRRFQQAEAAAYKEADRMSAAMQKQQREADKLAAEMRKAEQAIAGTGGAAATFSKGMGAVNLAAKGFIASQIVQFAVSLGKSYGNLSDTARLLEGRLKLVTSTSTELSMVQDQLFRQAQQTRSSYEGAVELYGRLALATKDTGIAQKDLLKFTELTQMAIKTSGATSQEASQAIIQLAQGFAAGRLQGQNLKSVLEQIPAVASAMAAGMGVSIGEFRKLAEQGVLTPEQIIAALLKMDSKIRKDFATSPKTISDAWTQSKNDILKSIGELDRAFGLSKALSFIAGIPGKAALAINPFAGMPTVYTTAGREAQAAANKAQARSLTPEGRAEAAAAVAAAEVARLKRVREEEAKATQERYKAWLQEKAHADEKAQWELDEINRAQRVLDLRLKASAAASGFNIRRPGGRTESVQFPTFGAGGLGIATAAAQTPTIQAAARFQQAMNQAEIERKRREGEKNVKDVLDAEKRNAEIAENFRENMQRALGDFFTEFVTKGKVSMRQMFDAIKQTGGSMAGQGISSVITGMLPKSMGPFGSILAGLGLVGLGGLFGSRNRTPRISAEERLAQAQNRYASIELLRQQRADEMRKFVEGRNGGRGGVIQSVGTVLQETTASRMIGELVAIRVATTRTADAVAGGGNGMSGAQVNVTVQGGMGADLKQVGSDVAAAVDRLLGTRVQALRLTSGAAVTT